MIEDIGPYFPHSSIQLELRNTLLRQGMFSLVHPSPHHSQLSYVKPIPHTTEAINWTL